MAYMIDLQRRCEHEGCSRFAERAVLAQGLHLGLYCLPHARLRVNELNEERSDPGH